MKLYSYFRSSAAYRVRIAINLKRASPEHVPVNLAKAQQHAEAFLALNAQGLVPTLVTDEGAVLTQSLAIIEWLEETHPSPPLLPPDPIGRARVRSIALAIACEIHPLNNTRVLNYLTGTFGVTAEQRNGWYKYWIDLGFEALEQRLLRERGTGGFCHGDAPTLADVCLVPQMANARRYNVDLAPYPTLLAIDAACRAMPAFADAAPDRQPDAV